MHLSYGNPGAPEKLQSHRCLFDGFGYKLLFNMARNAYQPGQMHPLEPECAATRILAAATAGNPCAQFMVGVMFLKGAGLDRDDRQAAGWLLRAAEQGLPQAQNDLAALYVEGRGLRRDRQQALYWLRRAADQGLTAARANLKRLREHSFPLHSSGSSSTPPPL